jgi:hypothetical protein
MSPDPDERGTARSKRQLVAETSFAVELRTPRAAAVAGIVFAVILTVVVVLLHMALPAGGDQSQWITQQARRQKVAWALELIPYAGIAFLWFIGVIRSQLGDREDKFFATAFLGSGILFVAMLFAAAANVGALLSLYGGRSGVPADEVRLVGAVGTALLATFGIRMAAVFTMVVTNLGRRSGIIPRWLLVVGYAAAAMLLFAPPRTLWAVLLFPVWVFMLSVQILVVSLRGAPSSEATTALS